MSNQFNITKFKSLCAAKEEECAAKIKSLRAELILLAAEDDFSIDKIHTRVMTIAQYQGAKVTYGKFAKAHETQTREKLLFHMLTFALNYEYDAWSGRGNDFRRIQRDGEKEAMFEIKSILEFYCEPETKDSPTV